MLTERQVQFFKDNGYVIAGKVLEDDEVAALREHLDACLRGESNTGGKAEYASTIEDKHEQDGGVFQIINIWKQDSTFRAHHSRPEIVEMGKQLTGADSLRIFHDQILSKPANNGKPVAWHQDYGYWRMVREPELVTCWIALDDATVANGCMQVIPGSHKWGLLAADTNLASDDPEALLKEIAPPPGASLDKVHCELPAGHAMWHHCLTLHGSGPNTTDKPRRGVISHIMPGHSTFAAEYAHLMANHASADGLRDGDVLQGRHFPEL